MILLKRTLFIYIIIICNSLAYSQFYNPTQITTINTNKTAFEGDLYLDTINDNYYIGLTNGGLSRIGMDSTKVSSIFYDLLDTINGSVFPIYAERSSALSDLSFQWAFGNGDNSQVGFGIIIPMNCELFAVGLTSRSGSAEVEVYKNNIATTHRSGTASPNAINSSFTPLQFSAGDVVTFQTVSALSATEGGKAVAWFRIPSKNTPAIRLYGGTIPASSLGNNDDEYLNTSTGDLYSKSAGVWSFQTNLKGVSGASSVRSYIQVTNVLSGDINSTVNTVFTWINPLASSHVTNDPTNFTVSIDGITINKTATYKVTVFQHQNTTIERTNAALTIVKNNVVEDGFGSNAYMRSFSGHNESTASISKIISVTSGDKIGISNIQQANSGIVTCPMNSLIFMIEEM